MPPRFAYWTIILDGTPTSFRTKEREDILPLFNQLKAKNPAALLKWFSGGRLWDSPEQAKDVRNVEKVRRFREERSKETKEQREAEDREMAAFREKHGRPADGSDQRIPDPSDRSGGASFGSPADRLAQDRSAPREGRPSSDPLAEFRRQHGRPADGSDQRPPAPPAWGPGSEDRGAPRAPRREGRGPGAPDRRGKDWRPGGEHKDPRGKYKLPPGEARKRWKERNLGPRVPKPFGSKPGGDRTRGPKPFGNPSTRGGGDNSLRAGKPFGSKPYGDRPFGDKPRPSTRDGQDRSLRTGGPQPFGGKPGGGRPWGAPGAGGRGASQPRAGRTGEGHPSTGGNGPDRTRDRKPFGDRPPSDRPFGDRPRRPKPFGSKPFGSKPFGPPSTRGGDDRSLRAGKPGARKPFGSKPGGGRPFGAKPRGPGKPPGGPRRKG